MWNTNKKDTEEAFSLLTDEFLSNDPRNIYGFVLCFTLAHKTAFGWHLIPMSTLKKNLAI